LAFIDEVVNLEHQDVAFLLHKELAEKVEQFELKLKHLGSVPPIQITVADTDLSPMSLLLCSSDNELARQLTREDYHLFKHIHISEFFNGNWNTQESRHLSPNLIQAMNRSIKVQSWIQMVIQHQDKLEDKVRIFTKMIAITDELLAINNFHTLHSFFIGLKELKMDFEVPPTISQKLLNLEKIVNPDKTDGFETYKHKLEESKSENKPVFPSLRILLQDLDQLDAKHADFYDPEKSMVNFGKRELLYTVTQFVTYSQQQSAFEFPIVEPLHSLIGELPSFKFKHFTGK